MQFPFLTTEKVLLTEDFDLFSYEFSQIVLQLIPYAEGPVSFIGDDIGEKDIEEATSLPASWKPKIITIRKKKRPLIGKTECVLYLPISSGEGLAGIVIVEGVEPSYINSLSKEWLVDRSWIISREFYRCKQLSHDPVNGFLNIRYLESELSALLEEKHTFSLVLIEVYPKATNTEKAQIYISKAGYYLSSYFQQHPLIHIDAGVFAFLWPGIDSYQTQKLGKIILDLLKREGFFRVHLGITTVASDRSDGRSFKGGFREIVDEAWQALRTARQRGPYALCMHHSLEGSATHPFLKPAVSVQTKLRNVWRKLDRFAVVFFQLNREALNKNVAKRLMSLGGESSHMIINGEAGYVLLEHFGRKQALAWAKSINTKIGKLGFEPLTMGIAIHPTGQSKKSDTLSNANKALLHTQFYGPGTATVYDAVSQNVSGDIYYREGDLRRAVKEYRLGLSLEPSNINLLNSLGEAYAQMNRHKEAMAYFAKALDFDSKDYMALFNLGVVHSKLHDDKQAITYFEKAYRVSESRSKDKNESPDRYDVSHDLLLPLARLYCRTAKYKKVIDLLADSSDIDTLQSGKAGKKGINPSGLLRYLGRAYKELKMNQKAIVALQKAVIHNPRDATSLSLLGELYLQEKQGDEIALSLCRQAVELDNARWDHWFRLGRVLFQCGKIQKAREALQESLAINNKDVDVLLLFGKIYRKLNDRTQSKKMYKMALKLQPSQKQAIKALATL